SGRLELSWADAQWRWRRPGTQRPDLPGQPWDGQPLESGLLLVHAEDSLSDTIRLLRFIPLLAKRGIRMALLVQTALVPLLSGMEGVERVLAQDHALADQPDLTAPDLTAPDLTAY
ncbi:MAG: hypothetical protein J0626_07180, partial [Rhodospirillaceae bacterium]|nr:hypothetical protein [Rhodospirillaceae bacterium]